MPGRMPEVALAITTAPSPESGAHPCDREGKPGIGHRGRGTEPSAFQICSLKSVGPVQGAPCGRQTPEARASPAGSTRRELCSLRAAVAQERRPARQIGDGRPELAAEPAPRRRVRARSKARRRRGGRVAVASEPAAEGWCAVRRAGEHVRWSACMVPMARRACRATSSPPQCETNVRVMANGRSRPGETRRFVPTATSVGCRDAPTRFFEVAAAVRSHHGPLSPRASPAECEAAARW